MKDAVTAARLREVLLYIPETGLFYWRYKPNRRICAGDEAGAMLRGRQQIKVDGCIYRSHRLAWLYVYGSMPENEIDHINGNPSDNRIINLRDVAHQHNVQNQRRPHSRNKLGFLGVSRNSHGNGFRARINDEYLGTFRTPQEAQQEYIRAKRQKHYGSTL